MLKIPADSRHMLKSEFARGVKKHACLHGAQIFAHANGGCFIRHNYYGLFAFFLNKRMNHMRLNGIGNTRCPDSRTIDIDAAGEAFEFIALFKHF